MQLQVHWIKLCPISFINLVILTMKMNSSCLVPKAGQMDKRKGRYNVTKQGPVWFLFFKTVIENLFLISTN